MAMTRFHALAIAVGAIACGLATKLCCEAVIRHKECRKIAVWRGSLQGRSARIAASGIRMVATTSIPPPRVNWPGKWQLMRATEEIEYYPELTQP